MPLQYNYPGFEISRYTPVGIMTLYELETDLNG
jgi:hypothetical protein